MPFNSGTVYGWFKKLFFLPPFRSFLANLQLLYTDAAVNLERHRVSCCSSVMPIDARTVSLLETFCGQMLSIVKSKHLWQQKEPVALIDLLRLYFFKDATDARDKVYGILSLVTDWGDSVAAIDPDYTLATIDLMKEWR